MKNIIIKLKKHGILSAIKYVFYSLFYGLSVKIYIKYLKKFVKVNCKQILFTSQPCFSDNAKALFEYMLNNDDFTDYTFVWLIGKNDAVPKGNYKNTVFVRRSSLFHGGFTFKALRKVSESKVIFFTHDSPVSQLSTNSEQIVINLWHGCGYKAAEGKNANMTCTNYFDYALVPGNVFVETKSQFWGCPKEKILPLGYPRYDWFYEENIHTESYVRTLCSGADKLIMWMPTFRKTEKGMYPEECINSDFDLPVLKSTEDLITLNNLCKEHNVILCIKRHPYQLKYMCESVEYSNIVFINNDDLNNNNVNLYSLLRYTDGLITDYSSVAIDYMLLDKPLAFMLEDFDKYADARGFVFDNPKDYMPGHHIYSIDDLITFICDVYSGSDTYSEKRNQLIGNVHNIYNGKYSDRIWNSISNLIPN